jgi:hypothetical protein
MKLFAEAIVVADKRLGRTTAWNIYQEQDDDRLHCLTPQLAPISNEGFETVRQLPLHKALDSLTHEIGILKGQRHAINPNQEAELSPERAVELARFEILGATFREAVLGRQGILEMVKAMGGNAYRHCYVAREKPSGPKEWDETIQQMQRALEHPLIIQVIIEKAQLLEQKDRFFAGRLEYLEHQRAGIAEKLSTEAESMKSSAAQVPAPKSAEVVDRQRATSYNPYSPEIRKGQSKAPRFKM